MSAKGAAPPARGLFVATVDELTVGGTPFTSLKRT
jgi:hypothetical protein